MRLNYDDFELEINDLLSKLEEEKQGYPETYAAIENYYGSVEPEDLLEFAYDVVGCEASEQIQKDVAEFLIALLLDIAENEENGDESRAAAANTLGALYYDGRIGEQSYAKATELYEFAANHGDAYAQENLGYVWYYGRTGQKDYEKAFQCFIKGALGGRPISMYKIGDMYKNGYYVEKDPIQAFKVYNAANNLLDSNEKIYSAGPDISMRLADCFFDGIGTEQNFNTALVLYQQAESLFYHRIQNGAHLFQGSLKHVIMNEQICRQKLLIGLPDFDWVENSGK